MKPRRDGLPFVKVSRLRATGLINPLMDEAEIEVGGHKARVGLWHMFFPNDGSWSYFVCPSCGRRAQILRLYDGRLVYQRCDGLSYQASDKGPRIERLRAQVAAKSLHRRKQPQWALRHALLAKRKERLKGWPLKPKPA